MASIHTGYSSEMQELKAHVHTGAEEEGAGGDLSSFAQAFRTVAKKWLYKIMLI